MIGRTSSRRLMYSICGTLCLLFFSCAGSPRQPTPEQVRAIPYKRAAIYAADIPAALAKPPEDRVAEAPPPLVDALREMDGESSYAPYMPSEEERALFADYFALLPDPFRQAFRERVLGVYFIESFKGGGMSDFVFGPDGAEYNILILNAKVLMASLADWIAYRDASPYQDDGKGLELRVSCSGDYRALLHTLVHETAHIYDYGRHATPFVEPAAAQGAWNASEKDFTRGVWTGYASREARYAIPDIDRTAFYGLGKKLPLSAALGQYEALAKTPFASLYASKSWVEDFAEAAAWAWLRERLGVEYSVSLLKGGRPLLVFAPGGAPSPGVSLAAREAALESILF